MAKFKTEGFENLEEFFPYYLSQHRNNMNRLLHIIGTLLANLILIYSLISANFKYLQYFPVVGYGFAWIGHFVFEKNKPATFGYFRYSLMSDYKMIYEVLTGNVHNIFKEYEIKNERFLDTNLF